MARGRRGTTALALAMGLWITSCSATDVADRTVEEMTTAPSATPATTSPAADEAEGLGTSDPPRPDQVLMVTAQRDGDSFVASDGVEYRVGLINTPELSDCGGSEAADRTYELLAAGFTTDAYAVDTYGRQVARILVEGGDLGQILAREGLADDRYLEQFRHENPPYASALDIVFDEARSQRAGLWQTCWTADPVMPLIPAPAIDDATTSGHRGRTGQWPCHPAYVECIPNGPDLDCRDVGHNVTLFGRDDPFRLDGNNTTATDGVGCDSYEPWSPDAIYPYYR